MSSTCVSVEKGCPVAVLLLSAMPCCFCGLAAAHSEKEGTDAEQPSALGDILQERCMLLWSVCYQQSALLKFCSARSSAFPLVIADEKNMDSPALHWALAQEFSWLVAPPVSCPEFHGVTMSNFVQGIPSLRRSTTCTCWLRYFL